MGTVIVILFIVWLVIILFSCVIVAEKCDINTFKETLTSLVTPPKYYDKYKDLYDDSNMRPWLVWAITLLWFKLFPTLLWLIYCVLLAPLALLLLIHWSYNTFIHKHLSQHFDIKEFWREVILYRFFLRRP